MKKVSIKFYGTADDWAFLDATDENVNKFIRYVSSAKNGNNNALVGITDTVGTDRFFCVTDIEMIRVDPIP